MDLNKFEPGKKEGTIKTPKCRLIYPSLFEPTNTKGSTVDTDEKKLKYRLALLVPKGANVDYLKERVNEVRSEMSAKEREAARLPFIKTADQQSLAKYADDYPLLLRVTSKYVPDVVGPGMGKIDESEAYSGRWGRAVLNPYAYPSIDGGKPGIALGLNSVQFLDHDEPIGGSRVSAEDEFEAVEVDGDDPGESEGEKSDNSALEGMFD